MEWGKHILQTLQTQKKAGPKIQYTPKQPFELVFFDDNDNLLDFRGIILSEKPIHICFVHLSSGILHQQGIDPLHKSEKKTIGKIIYIIYIPVYIYIISTNLLLHPLLKYVMFMVKNLAALNSSACFRIIRALVVEVFGGVSFVFFGEAGLKSTKKSWGNSV